MMQQGMKRAVLEDIELEYEVRGSGEPVVLIHPGHFADWFEPLMDEPALVGNYTVFRYHPTSYALVAGTESPRHG